MHGYIKAENKEQLARRLDRIEGQARGIKRMVDREAHCTAFIHRIDACEDRIRPSLGHSH